MYIITSTRARVLLARLALADMEQVSSCGEARWSGIYTSVMSYVVWG